MSKKALRAHSIEFDRSSSTIFVCYTKFEKDNLSNISVDKIEVDKNFNPTEKWKNLFKTESVSDVVDLSQRDGRAMHFSNNSHNVTSGNVKKYMRNGKMYISSDDISSYTGKIIKIDLGNKSTEIISRGHRNSQEIVYTYDGYQIAT